MSADLPAAKAVAPRDAPTRADLISAVRLVDAERNQRLVVAESALIGERMMAVFRLVFLFTMGGSQALAEHIGTFDAEASSPRGLGIASYVAFIVVSIIAMWRTTPNPRRAFIYPFVVATVDFTFMTWMDYCDLLEEGRISPAVSLAAGAVRARRIGEERVKGRSAPVVLYAVLGHGGE